VALLIRDALVSMGNDVHLLDKWYRKDSNKVGLTKLLFPIGQENKLTSKCRGGMFPK
jgi:hypothetical protein